MQPLESSESVICAILAAQVAALREHVDSGVTAELLWQTTDVLSGLSSLMLELKERCSGADSALNEKCTSALTTGAEISRSLDGLAFLQAQRQDFTRQMADCVVTALERLAASDAPVGNRLSVDDLAALYVSEEQREIHNAVASAFSNRILSQSSPPEAEIRPREGAGG